MIPVLGVHGIAFEGTYAAAWEQALAGAGVGAHVVEARWPSTGSFLGDIALLLMRPSYRRRCVDAVARGVKGFAATHRDGVLVGHSMGQPLLFAALRQLATRGAVVDHPIITIGGPSFHRVWGPSLRMAGLGRPPPGSSVLHFWNRDDPVCGSRPSHPSWCTHQRVAVAGRGGMTEHGASDYLGHPFAAGAIEAASRRAA